MCANTETLFKSILWPVGMPEGEAASEDTLHDLALDQVIVPLGEASPYARQAFAVPLRTAAEVDYRLEVFRALEDSSLRQAVEAFSHSMNECLRRNSIADQAHYPWQRELWHLRAVSLYTEAIEEFHSALTERLAKLKSPGTGWELLARHLIDYRSSEGFSTLRSRAVELRDRLASLRYNALINGARVTMAPTDNELDLGQAVLAVFDRFRREEATDYRTAFRDSGLDHVQA